MSLPGSVQNQQLETVRLRIFREVKKKKRIQKKRSNENVVVPITRNRVNRTALSRKKTRRWLSKNKAHYSLYEVNTFCSVPGQSSTWPKFSRPGRWGGSARDSSPRGTPPSQSWRLRRFRGSGHRLAPSFRMVYRCVDDPGLLL